MTRGVQVACLAGAALLVLPAVGRWSSVGAQQPRRLAPGVVTVIPAAPEEADTVAGPRPLVGLAPLEAKLRWDPKTFPASETVLALAQEAIFRRSIWQLEFGFKPVRFLRVTTTGPDGQRQDETVWYLMYYVRNAGGELRPVAAAEPGVFHVQPAARPLRFFPTFLLQGHDQPGLYRETIRPDVVEQIRQRERPGQTLHDSVSITQVELPVSEDPEEGKVWGVATWLGVDPATDFFSVLVQGLTNAYDWEADGSGQKTYRFRTLQLNFWRPGDVYRPDQDRVRYGVPLIDDPAEQQRVLNLFQLEDRLDHLWVYR